MEALMGNRSLMEFKVTSCFRKSFRDDSGATEKTRKFLVYRAMFIATFRKIGPFSCRSVP